MVTARVSAILASLLATALDRERLALEARASEAQRQRDALEAEALRRSDAVKTAVLRSVSHDLRSPITAIMTAGEVLADMGESLSETDRGELVASILGRSTPERSWRTCSSCRGSGGRRDATTSCGRSTGLLLACSMVDDGNERIDVDLPTDASSVEVDPAQIERALVNVLENAVKFSPPDARIELRATVADAEIVVRVTDSGPGIPARERERVFEPFVHTSGLDGQRGSGLGLAIARGFVDLNGGSLWAAEPPGGGASFVMTLPAVALPAEVLA